MLPILPFAAALIMMNLVYGLGEDTSALALPAAKPGADAEVRAFNAFVRYLTVGFVHVAICIAGIVYLVAQIRTRPPSEQRKIWGVIGVLFVVLVLANTAERLQSEPGALTLTYRLVCQAMVAAEVLSQITPDACDDKGISPFAWMAVVPYIFGLLAALCAAGVASSAALAPSGVGDAAQERTTMIERSFQVTAFLLVTSTLSMMLFYQLPAALLTDDHAKAMASSYGHGMTLFWGAVFTLTLLATYGPVALIMGGAPRPARKEAGAGITSFEGLRAQLSRFLAVLSPLIVGALGPMFEVLAGLL